MTGVGYKSPCRVEARHVRVCPSFRLLGLRGPICTHIQTYMTTAADGEK